jgi:hypothetical protein
VHVGAIVAACRLPPVRFSVLSSMFLLFQSPGMFLLATSLK